MIALAGQPERDAMDTALDLLTQKIERRVLAVEARERAFRNEARGFEKDACDVDVAKAQGELRLAVTNYNNAVRDQIEEMLAGRPCTLRELLGDAFSSLGEADRHALVIEENTPRVTS